MAFKNEYIPPIEQETSEFFKKARGILNTGHSQHDKWTVDRSNEMVLFIRGGRKEVEDFNRDTWRFLDAGGEYWITTECLHKKEISPDVIAISYKILGVVKDEKLISPNLETLLNVKEALRERKDWGLLSQYKECQLTLVDGTTGKEI